MTDRGSDTSRFDPRFDPAFQPGYDPRNRPDVRPASPYSPTRPSPAPLVSAASPAAASPAVAETVAAEPVPVPIDEPAVAGDGPTDDGASGRTRNPFVVALWLVSAVFFAGGVGLLRTLPAIEEGVRTSSQSFDFFFLQALMIGSPMLIVLGLATATGVLFLHAMLWSKRRSE